MIWRVKAMLGVLILSAFYVVGLLGYIWAGYLVTIP